MNDANAVALRIHAESSLEGLRPKLATGALLVLVEIGQRLQFGQDVHGPLDLGSWERDCEAEALEELDDAAIYWAIGRIMRRRRLLAETSQDLAAALTPRSHGEKCALLGESEPMSFATSTCDCGADAERTRWLQELVRHAIVWRRPSAGTNGVATVDVLVCARCGARGRRDFRELMHRRECVVGLLIASTGIPTTFVPF